MKHIKLTAILIALMLVLPFAAGCGMDDDGFVDEVIIPNATHAPLPTVEIASGPISDPAEPVSDPVEQLTEPTPTPEPTPVPDNGLPYYLYVEKGSFTLTIYSKDAQGNYTEIYKQYRIAHGGNKTPAGTYTLGSMEKRERWHDFPDGGTVQYATHYEGRLYIHSPLYATSDATQLWPMYYDGEKGIGKESTGGCLRMVTEASKFIFENCPEGTTLEIVNGSPRGTSSEEQPRRLDGYRRIDPTDIDTLKAKGYGG